MFKLKQMVSGAAAVVSLVFGIAPAMAGPTIGFGNIVSGSGMVSVDVVVGDLAGEIVSAYDLDVSYNVGALTFSTVLFGPSLGDVNAFEVFTAVESGLPGLVDFAASSLLDDAALGALQGGGPVTLATLQFTGSDLSSLAFINWGTDLVNDVTNDVKGRNALQIIPGGQIPEPATYGLVGMALLAAAVARRRQA